MEQLTIEKAQSIASKIYAKVVTDEKGHEYEGNQNCMLCTWCSEAQFRGIDILPRPVYSPRDIIFKYTPYGIVKNARKTSFKNLDYFKKSVSKVGPNSRFYVHVKWQNCNGGHEFIVLNIGENIYVYDGQAGLVADINSKPGMRYFGKIDIPESFYVRMDDKELNKEYLKFNDDKYIIYWNEEIDIPYLENERKKNKKKE